MIRKLLERLPFGYKKSWAEQHFTAILIIYDHLYEHRTAAKRVV
jgi:hypothetical protein